MSGCTFSFLLNMKVKSAPLQVGQNAYAEKGGLPHSSDTGEALGAPCSCPDRTLSPRGLQRGTPLPLQMSKKHERARECGRKLRGGNRGSSVIMRQEFTVEIVTMNNATVLPLERRRPQKTIPPDLMAETAH